jgi:RNA polymerase sigma-70 factor (ECF subfamily)
MAERLDFDGLVTAHYEKLYQFAYSLTRDTAEACDLVQQTFCIWATKGHQLRDVSKVKTWLFTTLHREFLGLQRKRSKFVHVEIDFAGEELIANAPVSAGSLDGLLVLETLGKLDELYQAPVALFYLQDCSYSEIAEILEVPVGTVKSRLARGLGKLHQMLADEASRPRPNPKNL